MDIAILFDGSSYITHQQFRRTQLFATTLLASFNISQEQTNVGAAVYARDVIISFGFTEHFNLTAVSEAIDNVSYLNQSSLNMSAALETVNKSLLAHGRENVTRILLVFASEMISGNFATISQELRSEGAIIIPIGVGNSNVNQLRAIASKPSVLLTTSFQHLDTMEGVVTGTIAEGKQKGFVCSFFNV